MTVQNSEFPLLGVFDSGVGGFSVYKKIRTVTDADIVYYGDTLRAPYGNKEEQEIIQCIRDDIQFLKDEGVTYFVNACNSMSVLTTEQLLKDCKVSFDHYVDMTRAFEKHTVCTKDDRVVVFATKATIESGSYERVLQKSGAQVFPYIFTTLAQAIEENRKRGDLLEIVRGGVEYAKSHDATHIVYGCTHYPLIHDIFKEVGDEYGLDVAYIDPADAVKEEVKQWHLVGDRKFYPHASKDTPAFIKYMVTLL